MIRGKPNVEAFLDGGNKTVQAPAVAALVSVDKPARVIAKPPKRVKKLFELPESMIADLEQRCVDERRTLGRRVTQTEIIERSLGTYLYSKP